MVERTKELLELIKERGKNRPHYKETTKDDKIKDEKIMKNLNKIKSFLHKILSYFCEILNIIFNYL